MSVPPYLWHVMQTAHGDADALREFANRVSREQLIMLNRLFGIAAGQLRAASGFEAHAEPGHAWKLASWVVSQGEPAWLEAMEDPTSQPTRPPADAPDFGEIMEGVYRRRFRSPIPDQEPRPRLRGLRPTAEWEEKLMEVIDLVEAGIPIEEVLGPYTRSDLIRLKAALGALTARLTEEFTGPLGEDPEGLDWLRWGDWFVGQGRQAWERYRAHPDELPREAPSDTRLFTDELERVYRGRYGERLPTYLDLEAASG